MNVPLRPAIVAFLVLTGLAGVAYPLLVLGLARCAFPEQAEGSLIRQNGRVLGSEWIGQAFTARGDFWGRPSATAGQNGQPLPCNAACSGGSNLAPGDPDQRQAVAARVALLLAADPGPGPIPGDLVTASGSGLDPHLSPAAAAWQIPRVARARGIPEAQVRALVNQFTEGRQWRLLGEARVQVLRLNLALDSLQTSP